MKENGEFSQRVAAEWPGPEDRSIYLNSGSCGIKPQSVLVALAEGYRKFNDNPTRITFLDEKIWQEARRASARYLDVEAAELALMSNSTQGLEIVLKSFLLNSGDGLLTTDEEHGSVKALARYLCEGRGVSWRAFPLKSAGQNSEELCRGLISLVDEKTKLVLVSEIFSSCGWRPDYSKLAQELRARDVPLLMDGAHAGGQGPLKLADYDIWVGSAHKWLGAPNGTGWLYCRPEWQKRILAVNIGDRYFNDGQTALSRLEWRGTMDTVKLMGLTAACELFIGLGASDIARRQRELTEYLRNGLLALVKTSGKEIEIKTPGTAGETSGLFTFIMPAGQNKCSSLLHYLWEEHKIWAQPDFFYGKEGDGLRISCHIMNTESELDKLLSALSRVI